MGTRTNTNQTKYSTNSTSRNGQLFETERRLREDRFATLAINPDKGRTVKINKLQIVGHISELNKQNQQVMVVNAPVKPITPISDTETNDLHTLKFKTTKDFQVCLNIGHESMKKEDLKASDKQS